MKVVTHNGLFHADDVFSWVLISRLWPEATLTRTRDEDIITAADMVFDVGMIFDPATGRFDHHMRDRPTREDSTPYSAFGLLWQYLGREFLATTDTGDNVEAVWEEIDKQLVLEIDRMDNGIGNPTPNHISSVIEQFNAPWDLPDNEDSSFQKAVAWAAIALDNSITYAASRQRALKQIKDATQASSDDRILELATAMPWEDAVFDLGLNDLLFVVHPYNDLWYAKAVPPERGGFGQRMGFPEEWRGLRGKDLAAVSGIKDAEFCHAAGFIAAACSRDGIIDLLNTCLIENQAQPIQKRPTP